MPTTFALRSSLLAALAATFITLPAAAQSIRAVARDAATGAPVPEAMVRVQAADGSLKAVAFADSSGVAVLRLREPGTYRVEARRAGYSEGSVQVEAGADQARADIRMARRPITLDTVVAFGRMEMERGRVGFERRRASGDGVFLDSAYLDARAGRVAFVGDMLNGVPGVYTQRTTRGMTAVRSTRGWQCMVMLVDGRPLPLRFADGGTRELHQVIGPRDIKGVEVYREASEVPEEFHQYSARGRYRCGVYLYWTRAGW